MTNPHQNQSCILNLEYVRLRQWHQRLACHKDRNEQFSGCQETHTQKSDQQLSQMPTVNPQPILPTWSAKSISAESSLSGQVAHDEGREERLYGKSISAQRQWSIAIPQHKSSDCNASLLITISLTHTLLTHILLRPPPGVNISAVGTSCSPGRTHRMGPSSLW